MPCLCLLCRRLKMMEILSDMTSMRCLSSDRLYFISCLKATVNEILRQKHGSNKMFSFLAEFLSGMKFTLTLRTGDFDMIKYMYLH